MHTELSSTVQYALPMSDHLIPLNTLLGKQFSLTHTGTINCVHCGRKINKSFNQGYCYPCFTTLAQCDLCIMKPETCHFDQGTCREPEWAQNHCMQPHIVYLANTSGLKVGITRKTQLPTRWIDQGAIQAIPIIQATSRFHVGLIENELKKHISDRTSWQRMLKGDTSTLDLAHERDLILKKTDPVLRELGVRFGENSWSLLSKESIAINYPVIEHPKKCKSFNFDKVNTVSGVLMGIKGQYLIFDSGVINIRKFGGYDVILSE
ncbi:MAG TPA: DUF2797 domain-containing protein [Crenotrichaceae bacterium]|nr:DUF2797 domain-containing protein [Crenotrichaceae bacterium]